MPLPLRRSAEGPSFLDPGWTPPLRGLLDPNEKEAVQERVQRPVPKVLKARAKSPAPARATPRRINPRPCPRVALSLLPTVRPKSARPKVLVPFGSTVERPRSCLGGGGREMPGWVAISWIGMDLEWCFQWISMVFPMILLVFQGKSGPTRGSADRKAAQAPCPSAGASYWRS